MIVSLYAIFCTACFFDVCVFFNDLSLTKKSEIGCFFRSIYMNNEVEKIYENKNIIDFIFLGYGERKEGSPLSIRTGMKCSEPELQIGRSMGSERYCLEYIFLYKNYR